MVAITPDGKYAYVNKGNAQVTVITTATGKKSRPIPLRTDPFETRNLIGGQARAVTPDGKHTYVAHFNGSSVKPIMGPADGEGWVSVIDTATGDESARIPFPVNAGPDRVVITPDGEHAYVDNNGNNTVSVITTATNEVSATIPVGTAPNGLTMTPDGEHVYVTNSDDGTVSVISTATNVVSATFPRRPRSEGLDDHPGRQIRVPGRWLWHRVSDHDRDQCRVADHNGDGGVAICRADRPLTPIMTVPTAVTITRAVRCQLDRLPCASGPFLGDGERGPKPSLHGWCSADHGLVRYR